MSGGMELQVWGGDWGLPSFDPRSLQMMTYAKLCGAPVKVRITNNPFRSPTGQLPVFVHNKMVISDFQEFVAYLKQKNYSTDMSLTNEQKAEIVAYINLLEEKLWPAMLYLRWLDERNYTELIRPWYAKALPFPCNYYYPGSYQRQTQALMEGLYPNTVSPSEQETLALHQAEKCLTLLSWKLDSRSHFSTYGATSLDAYIVGLLAPLLRAPWPSAALSNYARACTNLAEFSRLMLKRHFPSSALDAAIHPGVFQRLTSRKDSEDGESSSRFMNRFLAVLIAVVATWGYAVSAGILPTSMGLGSGSKSRLVHKKMSDSVFGEEQ